MKKLAIITSHPIQYNAPLFRLLTERGNIQLKVFYTWGQTEQGFVYDPDFKQEFKWDIPLLDGYEKEFVENVSTNPGAGQFNGIKNKDLVERIDRYNPDTLLVYGWSFHSHLQVLRHYKGKKKILFRGDSNLLDEKPGFSFKKAARRIFLSWVYRHVDLVLYTGEANRQYYLRHCLKDQQMVYAPHAVENERFFDEDGTKEQQAEAWRVQLGLPDHAFVFLFAGKLEPKKDPGLLIDAFMQLTAPDARLLIAGNGMLELELKTKAAADQRIIFLGFQNQQRMPLLYRLADVFVLPSKGPGETWGLSVNEAMACGRAVIVSDRCGCAASLVQGGKNGFIFEACKMEELRDCFQRFLNGTAVSGPMGANSRELIKDFSVEHIAEQIELTA